MWLWYFGSIGSEEITRYPLVERILRFSLLVFPLYLLGLWILPALAPVYLPMVLIGLGGFNDYQGRGLTFLVDDRSIVFRSTRPPLFIAGLDTSLIWASIAFFLALVLATPAMRWQSRIKAVAWGSLVLFLYHTCFSIAELETSMINGQIGLASSSHLFWNSAGYFLKFMGVIVVPLACWLLWGMKYLTGTPDVMPKPSTVGRNQKCPCGSGLKYKHCCGKN